MSCLRKPIKLIGLFSFLVHFSVAYAAPEETTARVIREGAVLRQSADNESPVMMSLPLGAVVDVEEVLEGWLKVKVPPGKDGIVIIGFINSSFVELERGAKTGEIKPEYARAGRPAAGMGRRSRAETPAGFKSFALNATWGTVSTGLEDEREYYEGFSSGPSLQAGLRYFFRKDDPYAGRVFLGLSYLRCSLKVDMEPIIIGGDENGNEFYAVFEPLSVQNYIFELGVTTSMIMRNSYLFFIFGAGVSHNSGKISGEWRTPAGRLIARTDEESYSDNQYPIRLKAGAVFGITSRLGLEIDLLADILYAGQARSSWGQTYAQSKGGIFGFGIGLSLNL